MACIPFAFAVAFGYQGDRPMSVDILRNSANTPANNVAASKEKGINPIPDLEKITKHYDKKVKSQHKAGFLLAEHIRLLSKPST